MNCDQCQWSPFGAALSISSNVFFVHLGLSFIIGTEAMSLIAQAVGANATDRTGSIFKQSLMLGVFVGMTAAAVSFFAAHSYIRFFGGTGQALKWGVEYFQIYSVSLLFLLLLHVFGACYRGIGKTIPTLVCALADNMVCALADNMVFAGAVLTLPMIFNLGISSVWWIKLITAVMEVVLCSVWLKYHMKKVMQA